MIRISCTANKGIHIETMKGLTISIQWGIHNYGTNRNAPSEEACIPANMAEVAFFYHGGPLLDLPNHDQVIGYVPVEEALALALQLNPLDKAEAKALIDEFTGRMRT